MFVSMALGDKTARPLSKHAMCSKAMDDLSGVGTAPYYLMERRRLFGRVLNFIKDISCHSFAHGYVPPFIGETF
jgi:hypothetical protein